MNDLLARLGKRIQGLRSAKTWSQEEFAHVSGFHRTYVGQIERGEENISFANLAKISGVLGLTMSQLLAVLEDGSERESQANRGPENRSDDPAHQLFEIQKVARRLKLQRASMDRRSWNSKSSPPEPQIRSGSLQAGRAARKSK